MCVFRYFAPALRLLLITILVVLCAAFLMHPWKSHAGATGRGAVVIELFTSEGCSSCPPADNLLTHLRQDMAGKGIEVIPLGFHVDYWNSLGWKDRFSSAEFSQRQEQYARTLGVDGPYTPQMVVNGKKEFVGSNAGRAQRAITEAAGEPAAVEVGISLNPGNQLGVQVKGSASANGAAVILAVTEDNLTTQVGAGENNGHELRHTAVVRRLKQIGTVQEGSFKTDFALKVEKDWKPGDLRAVVFVQQSGPGRVLGAASVPLPAQAR
ncbi:MAG TPA: DUF1223 domain-containing protein [Candidatus Sulfotelmatobacter sp.]|nr:DUF1223 domain-containing protein [Candidatus Sulfotelmatobacter sp.]